MLFIFYFLNLLFGLIVAFPFRAMLVNFAGQSLMGKSLAEHFDLEFLFEFLTKNDGAISTLMALFFVAGAIYWIGGLFLSGGAYGVLVSGERYTARSFWQNAGHYFPRFVRLFLWSLPFFAIFYCLRFLENGFVRLVYGKDPYQNIIFWGSAVSTGLGYIGILLYYLVLDYARIYVIRTGEYKMYKAILHGFSFVFRNIFTTFTLSITLFLTGVLALLLYNPIADALHAPNGFIVALLLIVQQCYIIFRMFLRLTLYAGQVSVHRSRLTEKPPIVQEAPSNAGDFEPAIRL